MFEDLCLTCGKQLCDINLAYCSDDCQSQDTSPSISSASSAVSSPRFGYAAGADVPPLVPSVLGSLRSKAVRSRHGYSFSSSSASSTSWSLSTDYDDRSDPIFPFRSYAPQFRRSVDSLDDGSSKSSFLHDLAQPTVLSYARRPAGINNHSTIPNPHGRTQASNHMSRVPSSTHLLDDDILHADLAASSRDASEINFLYPKATSKKKRSRASLPAYFSLLRVGSSTDDHQLSSVADDSENRRTPPTPKPTLSGLHTTQSFSSLSLSTPRGRRRTLEDLSIRSQATLSPSPSPSRRARRDLSQGSPHTQPENCADDPNGPRLHDVTRGREQARNQRQLVHSDIHRVTPESRGRVKLNPDTHAPGLGHGRSGLLDRERTSLTRPAHPV